MSPEARESDESGESNERNRQWPKELPRVSRKKGEKKGKKGDILNYWQQHFVSAVSTLKAPRMTACAPAVWTPDAVPFAPAPNSELIAARPWRGNRQARHLTGQRGAM